MAETVRDDERLGTALENKRFADTAQFSVAPGRVLVFRTAAVLAARPGILPFAFRYRPGIDPKSVCA